MTPRLPEGTGELSRRGMIINTGLSALAIGALSACSNYGNQPAAPTSAPGADGNASGSPGSGTAGSDSGGLTAAKADIPVGGGKIFPDAQTVVTQPKSGEFKAFTAVCTHQTCIVTEVVETINCDCHGSKFSITDGSVVTGPAPSPLAAKTVTANGGNLTIT
jgi:Rieske Fe-S protein